MHRDPDSWWRLRGADSLDDTALLSFLLTRGGAPGPSTVGLAQAVLGKAGGLAGLPRMGEAEFCTVPGVGPSRARRLLAFVELARRLSERPVPRGADCSNPESIYRMVRGRLLERRQETLWVLLLDARGRKIELLELARGGRNAVSVSPAEVFERGIREGASQLVLIHNHPSGDPEPSPQDRGLTQRMQRAGEILGVAVVDHIIVGRNSYCSLAARGLLPGEGSSRCDLRDEGSAHELRASDGGRTALLDRREQRTRLRDEETTAWVFPEQLPLPFQQGDLAWFDCGRAGDTLDAGTDPVRPRP